MNKQAIKRLLWLIREWNYLYGISIRHFHRFGFRIYYRRPKTLILSAQMSITDTRTSLMSSKDSPRYLLKKLDSEMEETKKNYGPLISRWVSGRVEEKPKIGDFSTWVMYVEGLKL